MRKFLSVVVAAAGVLVGMTGPLPAGADETVVPDSNGGQVSVSPTRLVDTRTGLGLSAPIPAHRSASLYVVSTQLVATTEFRVTAVAPAASGYLTVYPGTDRPQSVSSENFTRGRTSSNLTFVNYSANGIVSIYNGSSAPLQVELDETGHVTGSALLAGMYADTAAGRILDTRSGAGTGGVRGALGAHRTLTVQAVPVTPVGGVPPAPVSAAIVNLSAVDPSSPGYVTAYAPGTPRPLTSTLNYAPGAVIDNLAVVPVDAAGRITLYNGSAAAVNLTADVEGVYLGGVGVPTVYESLQQVPAARVVDTRARIGATSVPAGGTVRVTLAGHGGLSSTATGAALLNLTAVAPTAAGYLVAYPGDVARPTSSSVDFGAGATTASTSVVPVAADGTIDVHNASPRPVDFVLDVSGYYLDAPASRPDPLDWTPAPVVFPRDEDGSFFAVQDLSCPTSSWCAAIDDGYVNTFTPSGYQAHYRLAHGGHVPDSGSISCSSATFCAASTSSGFFRFDGTRWHQVSTDTRYVHISCVFGAFCLATDGVDVAAVLDIKGWHPIAAPVGRPTSTLSDDTYHPLSCASGDFCLYVDPDGYASIWDGATWSTPVSADPIGALTDGRVGPISVSCAGAQLCMIVDRANNVITYQQGKFGLPFNLDDASFGDGGGVEAVSCATSVFCAVTDRNGVRTWDGASWSAGVALPPPVTDTVIACASLASCVVPTGGGIFIGKFG